MKMVAVRLAPGKDLKKELEKLVEERLITSGFVMTCAGSLSKATIRMAGAKAHTQEDVRVFEGDYEIVSLVGTLSRQGSHLHISISDVDGKVIGGHLKTGSEITTTAEVVVGYDEHVTFKRLLDPVTGFDELIIE